MSVRLLGFGLLLLALSGQLAVAQQDENVDAPDPPASEEETLQRWVEYMTPGDQHEVLKKRVGTWDFTIKIWETADGEPQESTGTSEISLIMGGRYLLDRTTSSFDGQPFEGLGIVGYDKFRNRFVSVWVDNFSTGIMSGIGTYNEERKVIRIRSQVPDFATNEMTTMRSVERIVNDDRWNVTSFLTGPDGEEFKTMEIRYRRRP